MSQEKIDNLEKNQKIFFDYFSQETFLKPQEVKEMKKMKERISELEKNQKIFYDFFETISNNESKKIKEFKK